MGSDTDTIATFNILGQKKTTYKIKIDRENGASGDQVHGKRQLIMDSEKKR